MIKELLKQRNITYKYHSEFIFSTNNLMGKKSDKKIDIFLNNTQKMIVDHFYLF